MEVLIALGIIVLSTVLLLAWVGRQVHVTWGKVAFWCPCWLFLSLLCVLFIVTLGCTSNEQPTATPWVPSDEYKCLQKETRTDRTDANLDRAYALCYNGEAGGDLWKDK